MKLLTSVELKHAYKHLKEIKALEEKVSKLKDAELKAKTQEFRERFAKGEKLESLLSEVFAVAREAILRINKKRLFDVQILGGVVLTKGSVAEMKTGEGKTLTSVPPVYLFSITGESVIISTVNEYLTQRDANELTPIYEFLGLSVGINLTSLGASEKRDAYAKDITYSVHSEIGFDYLRDNMVPTLEDKVQRPFSYVLIDEVDSILIDEARTPLIISGGSGVPAQEYVRTDLFAKSLDKNNYEIDLESKSIYLTNSGVDRANSYFGVINLFDLSNSETVHRVQNALRANFVMHRDADYIVRDNKIEIVDSFTGRIMEGRSFSDGLHQAIEAKEKVEITQENQTLATITYQNLFRMFKKICGMTGTAKTEEDEFISIYNMRVHQIPTNQPLIRIDHPDEVYATAQAKQKAVIKLIKEVNARKQPILLGTEEVSESEMYSDAFTRAGIKHIVLNAKQNESEAEIVARAGEASAVTIATNMAGRGTDIKPTPEALAAGGLYVIATNKAESRRIDNQLIGRSGRQGDIGESKFIISLDDKLISRFSNKEKLQKLFASYGDEKIQGRQIIRVIKKAQIRIEGMNFDARKNVLQYDDVIRQQRDLIYSQRDIIIGYKDLIFVIRRMIKSVINDIIDDPSFATFKTADGSIDADQIAKVLNILWFSLTEFKLNSNEINHKSNDEIKEVIAKHTIEVYDQLRDNIITNATETGLHQIERQILLSTFDSNWQLHIDKMSRLKSSTNFSQYAQKNPFQVYAEKGAENFNDLLKRISHNSVRQLFNNRLAAKRTDPTMQAITQVVEQAIAKQHETKETVVESSSEKTSETTSKD